MASGDIWRTLEKVATVIGIVWTLAALVLLGYFASLGFHLVRAAG
jgi:UPF0716 family protein affecting phage T7 exclusion